jgi:hypothetical protein
VAGGHQTTVADASPLIAVGSVGALTVVLAAALLAVAGQDASVPDGFFFCAALIAVLEADDAALTAAAVLAAPVALAAPGDFAVLVAA